MDSKQVHIIGAGLAGSEAALQLAARGVRVSLFEQRPAVRTAVHETGLCAELVCSNSLKSVKPASAAGMLKAELETLGSPVFACARATSVPAGGALAVDRMRFSESVTRLVKEHPLIGRVGGEAVSVREDGRVIYRDAAGDERVSPPADAVLIATGPLTGDSLAHWLEDKTGSRGLAFYDAAAPIVMADSLDESRIFRQSRYGGDAPGDYLNAPFTKEEYESFIAELIAADRVIGRDFETKDLFNACQPIEEIARKGVDAPRFGPLKPVGLVDPATGRRPWAALQLRAEDAAGQSCNLVGFQTNLTFGEQKRVFRMIPGLEHAEFARFGVMHRNTFVDAPHILDANLRLSSARGVPVYLAGQLSGTEGYCEAMRSGLHAAISIDFLLRGMRPPALPRETAFGALIAYATDPATVDYQPMHVNFGIMPPLEPPIRNKQARYAAYAERGTQALERYARAVG